MKKIKASVWERAAFGVGLGLIVAGGAGCGGQDDEPPGGGSGDPCGGIAGFTCPAGMFCDFEANSCGYGDILGTCRPIPDVCTQECTETCGCDGKSYCNACMAHMAGIDDGPLASCDTEPPEPPTVR